MTPTVVLRIVAGAGVLALAGLLGWRLAHQDTKVAKAVAHGKVVPAPAFDLTRLDGQGKISLASLRGKAVVLNFWQSECAPCKQEMPRLQDAADRWAGKRVQVVGIDVLDFKSAARRFVNSHGVTYPSGFDSLGDVASRYGVANTPTTFFVDRRGRIVKRVLGPVSDSELDTEIEQALRT